MSNHRNPRPSLSRPFPDKFDPTASHDDVLAAGPLADHIDAIVHGLTEILGDPRAFVAPVPSPHSTFALDVTLDAVPEHVTATAVQAAIVADARRGTPEQGRDEGRARAPPRRSRTRTTSASSFTTTEGG